MEALLLAHLPVPGIIEMVNEYCRFTGVLDSEIKEDVYGIVSLTVLPGNRFVSRSNNPISENIRIHNYDGKNQVMSFFGENFSEIVVIPGGRFAFATSRLIAKNRPYDYDETVDFEYENIIVIVDADMNFKILKCHKIKVGCLIALPDNRIAVSGYDDTIQVRGVDDGTYEVLKGHTRKVTCLAVLPNDRLASGGGDNDIRIWDIKEKRTIQILRGHTDWVIILVILLDGRLASASEDKTIRIWNDDGVSHILNSPDEVQTGKISCMIPLPNGKLASGSWPNILRIWNIDGTYQELIGHTSSIKKLAILSDGRLVSGSSDETILIWNEDGTSQVLRSKNHINSLIVTSDDRIVSGYGNGTITIWR